MSGRDFPRPWLHREHASGPRLALLVVVAVLIVVAVLALGDTAAEQVPAPTVTVGTSGDAVPFEVEP